MEGHQTNSGFDSANGEHGAVVLTSDRTRVCGYSDGDRGYETIDDSKTAVGRDGVVARTVTEMTTRVNRKRAITGGTAVVPVNANRGETITGRLVVGGSGVRSMVEGVRRTKTKREKEDKDVRGTGRDATGERERRQ